MPIVSKFQIAFLCIFSFFAATNVFAAGVTLTDAEAQFIKDHPVISLGSDSNWAPAVILNDDGSIDGYDHDLLSLINEKTGANFQLVVGNWLDMVAKARNHEIDGLSTSAKHKERATFLSFSDSYFSFSRALIVATNNPQQINTVKDLRGKTIGYNSKNLFDKKIISQYKDLNLISYASRIDLIDGVVTNEVDAIISDNFIYHVKTGHKAHLKTVDFFPNSEINLVFSVRKDFPEAVSILNKGLRGLSNEERVELNNKWFLGFKADQQHKHRVSLTPEEEGWIHQKQVIRVQNLKTFPPFNFIEGDTPAGYTIDYVQLLGEYIGIEIEFISGKSWSDYLSMLKEGTLDVIPHIAVNDERKKFVAYTNFNHIEYTTGVAVRKDLEVTSISDLKDKVIAVTNKSFLHTHLKNNFPNQPLLLVTSTSKAVEAVSLAKADAVIGSLPTLHYYIQEKWLNNVKTVEIEDLGVPSKTALPMGVSKDNTLLLSILEKAHKAIAHREIVKLKQKWLDTSKGVQTVALTAEEKVYLRNKKELKLCVSKDWMPFERLDDGQLQGASAEYLKRFQEKVHVPVTVIPIERGAGIDHYEQERICDALTMVDKDPAREKYWDYSTPYIEAPLIIATRVDVPFISDIVGMVQQAVGVVSGSAYLSDIKTKYPKMKLVEVASVAEGLSLVENQTLFGFIGTLQGVGYHIQENYLGDLKIGGTFNESWQFYTATRSDEKLLNSIVNKFLQTMSPEEHRDIANKWMSIKFERSVDYRKLFFLSIFFITVILIVLYKNRSIHRINSKLALAHHEIKEQQDMVNKYVLIAETDLEGVVVEANEAYCRTFGYSRDEVVGKKHDAMRYPSMSKALFSEMWLALKAGQPWNGELINYTKDKNIKHLSIYIEPKMKGGQKIGYRAIYEDITDKKQIEELSITDKLTGVYNRVKLDEVLLERVATNKRYNLPFTVILLDLDDFKAVNDNYGHDVGDYVLKKIAAILRGNTRATDVVGRWGGEEFLIICENSELKSGLIVAENLRAAIESEIFVKVGKVTASFGVSEFGEDDTISTVFKKADQALYQAKDGGKNRVFFI